MLISFVGAKPMSNSFLSQGLDKKRRGEVVKEKPRLTRTTSADSFESRPRRIIIN